MRAAALAVALGALLLAGCVHDDSRAADSPKNQDPRGTPADRTGGARNAPDGAGGGPKAPEQKK